jgi:acetyl-CoA C-acetyltransferase
LRPQKIEKIMNEVFIVAAARTPVGSFGGSLASVSATQLGAAAIKGALKKINLSVTEVQEVLMGCVLQGNLGQAPARQAAKFAGLPDSVICTTVNKVCASGMKSITLGAQSIQLGIHDVVIAGGMENMSAAPYYIEKARYGYKYGNGQLLDSIVKDGLMDVYHNYPMGNAGELCASDLKISREEQDAYAIESYTRSAKAWKEGKFNAEIAPVEIPQKKGDAIIISEDEEYKNVKFEKIPTLQPVFTKDGTITAANASTINDGASALILMSGRKLKELGLTPIAKIISSADAEQAPEWFTTTPAKAIPLAVERAGLSMDKIDYFEINEAFSVVCIANNNLMKLNPAKVNAFGGAVSLGHALGSSGSRIVVTLLSVLKDKNAKYGVAGICNGGGGATALVVEMM